MNRLWMLTKFFLKNFYGSLTSNMKTGGQKAAALIGIGALLIMVAVPITAFVALLYGVLSQFDQKELILGTLFNGASTVVFIFGITGVISVFYFNNDVEWLLPLPIKPSHIVIGKFLTLLAYEYIILLVVVPGVITYGVLDGAGIIYYLTALIVFISIPVVPIAYGTILSFLLMRFTNLSKHKDAFKVVTGLFGLFLGLGINFFAQRMGRNNFIVNDPQDIQQIFGQGSLLDKTSTIFFNSKLSAYALSESGTTKGFINLALLILIILLIMVVIYVLADKVYIKGVVGLSESSSTKKNLTIEERKSLLKQSSELKTWMIREVKILFRTPAYVINCISTLILPIVVFIIAFMGQGQAGVSEIRTFIGNVNNKFIIVGIYMAFMAFSVSTNSIAATAISREGRELFVIKYLPTNKKIQLLAKVNVSILLSTITNLICVIALSFFYVDLLTLIAGFLMGEAMIILISLLGVIVDSYAPKLYWESEQQAVKNNLNSLKVMGISILITIIGIGIYLIANAIISNIVGIVCVLVYLSVALVLSYKILTEKATKRIEKLE